MLYGVSPMAPAPFAVAAFVLIGAGVAAALLPSRSALRVDPLTAIRTE
jgi:ABC-type antimicrobial peptide transport system permease subunit